MKKTVAILILAIGAGFVLQAFKSNPAPGPGIPDDVKEVLKASCYDCHSNDASGKKSKIALNFDKWEGYKLTKKISKLEDICTLVGENKMPPEKYLKSNPDGALSDDQIKLICDWTGKASEELMVGGE
jgi:cytochrome c5